MERQQRLTRGQWVALLRREFPTLVETKLCASCKRLTYEDRGPCSFCPHCIEGTL